MNLTLTQKRIIETSGNLVVKASAGTGKTLTLVNKLVYEIEKNTTHKVIAAITFTIKASQEIKDRLTIDVNRHFIGTNNHFVIEEIIKPFMRDVYGNDYNISMSVDYSITENSFNEALLRIKDDGCIPSFNNKNNKGNFIFQLAKKIIEKSEACQLYLKSKYFKIYIDEYQDCDKDMHDFFMFICKELNIELFIVGDEKQSIYIWRGASPDAFKNIGKNDLFKTIYLEDNFRSCQAIRNYSNMLFEGTRQLYVEMENDNSIILIKSNRNDWCENVKKHIHSNQNLSLLRYKNKDAKDGARELTNAGIDCVFVPKIPIAAITTDTAWLYYEIANYFIIDGYSVYDIISKIPVEGDHFRNKTSVIKKYLDNIYKSKGSSSDFVKCSQELVNYLSYSSTENHLKQLYETIINEEYHISFKTEEHHNNIAITFHSSKGLEFDQVIMFAEDYNLNQAVDMYNHYVAVTRAKSKLIIVATQNAYETYYNSLQKIITPSGLNLNHLLNVL